jgi:carbohydrate kinase (thermoresistant glucokinase family)
VTTVIFIVGVSGSGKSTLMQALTDALGWPGIEADDLHGSSNVEKMRAGVPLTDADRWPWLDRVAAEVTRRTAHGQPVVVACSALKRAYRDRLRAAAPDSLFVYLEGNRTVIEERLRRRQGHFMSPALIDSQFATLEPPDVTEHAITIPANHPIEDSVHQVAAAIRSA